LGLFLALLLCISFVGIEAGDGNVFVLDDDAFTVAIGVNEDSVAAGSRVNRRLKVIEILAALIVYGYCRGIYLNGSYETYEERGSFLHYWVSLQVEL